MNGSKWRRARIVLVGTMLALSSIATAAGPALADPASAIIDNGTVQLGVWAQGHLNVPGGTPSLDGNTIVGLRYVATTAEATADGCTCEGWGAADALSGVTGSANDAVGGVDNIHVQSFTTTASTAVSVVTIGDIETPTLRVTHDYHPSAATPYLYEVTVTIENVSDANIDARYRRVMDWDIEPTPFDEFVTIQRGSATALLYSSNDGFAPADPLDGPSEIGVENADVVDYGPADHGALFDFGFGTVEPGASVSFRTFYGAAGNETDALAALAAVGAEAYSFGQPNVEGGPNLGTPNTFIFAFAGIGGRPIVGAPTTGVQIPGIAISKSASAATVSAGGSVTYTYAVTNTSFDALLTGIAVSDDKCASVAFTGGDANHDGNLQIGETWTYNCTTSLTSTTTNVATATGTWRTQTVSATASATVNVGPASTSEVLAETGRPQISLPPTSTVNADDDGTMSPSLGLTLLLLSAIGVLARLVAPARSRIRR